MLLSSPSTPLNLSFFLLHMNFPLLCFPFSYLNNFFFFLFQYLLCRDQQIRSWAWLLMMVNQRQAKQAVNSAKIGRWYDSAFVTWPSTHPSDRYTCCSVNHSWNDSALVTQGLGTYHTDSSPVLGTYLSDSVVIISVGYHWLFSSIFFPYIYFRTCMYVCLWGSPQGNQWKCLDSCSSIHLVFCSSKSKTFWCTWSIG